MAVGSNKVYELIDHSSYSDLAPYDFHLLYTLKKKHWLGSNGIPALQQQGKKCGSPSGSMLKNQPAFLTYHENIFVSL